MNDDKLLLIKKAFDGEAELNLAQARALLAEEIAEAQGSWGTPVALKALAFLLYKNGALDDVPLIWCAKTSNFDCFSSLDVELLAGAGPEPTIAYLESQSLQALPVVEHSGQSWTVVAYMKACLQSGDFARRDSGYIESVEDEIRDNFDDLGL
ncbi:hypothetical protein [Microvirga sp. P5_D2]